MTSPKEIGEGLWMVIRAAAAGLIAISLVACTPDKVASKGTISGIAAPCAGLAARGHVPVVARHDGHAVARQVADGRSRWRYKLLLAAGTYRIAAPRSGDRSTTVSLHAGEKIVVNFPNKCD